MPVQIQLRHGTAAEWTAADPTLALGEVGTETDTNKFKVGTGSTAWNALGYATGGTGDPGTPGAPGTDGADGDPGAPGVGIPVGGVAAQRLAKIDATDYNTEWVTPSDAITEILTIPTAEMTATKVLAPDGAGGVEFRAEAGGGGFTVEEVDGAPTDSAVTKLVLPNGTLAIASHVATYTPIWTPDTPPSSPSAYDQEFASLTGQTTLGSLDSLNVTDAANYLHLARTTGGHFADGVYWSGPSVPFTMTACFPDALLGINFQSFGLMLTETSPGKLFTWLQRSHSSYGGCAMSYAKWTNRTTEDGSVDSQTTSASLPSQRYMRMVVTSGSSIVLQTSMSGLIWRTVYSGINSGLTPANFGLVLWGYNAVALNLYTKWIRFVAGTAGQTWNGYAWV